MYNPSIDQNLLNYAFSLVDQSTTYERRVDTLSTSLSLTGGIIGLINLFGNFFLGSL